jgi:hypothetical protein
MEINDIVFECTKQQLPINYMIRNNSEESNIIVFEKGRLYADIECYDVGITLAVISDKTNNSDVWTVENLSTSVSKIKNFLDEKV